MAGTIDVGETTNNSTGVTGKINLEEARSRADSLSQSAEVMKTIIVKKVYYGTNRYL